ncbi:DUF4129 domain-containing protein [Halovivax limisalsi]|uniref:DUF4129 domain-containing protein n=1 Tax=Halovivax limisalsi TaxID=1453760 RepID=UPI001FFC8C98|nr:DUF4129 domain-containing protein [Halovivax limisalsi]
MTSRETALRLTAAIVAILALAVVASVLPDVIEPAGGGGGGVSDGSGTSQPNVSGTEPAPDNPGNVLFLRLIVAGLLGLFVVAIVWMVLYDRRELLALLRRMAGVAVVVAILLAVVVAVMEPPELGPMENMTGTGGGTGPGEAGPAPGDSGESNTDSNLLSVNDVLLFAVVLLAVVAIGYVLKRRLERDDGEVGETLPEETPAEEVADVAGATADRIQSDVNGAVENEVFRAWKRMTEVLPVDNPASSTPGEFADAAIDAGFDPDDVGELTSLFEAVRYGPADATDIETDRAISIMRRIESAADTDGQLEAAPGERE